MGMKIE